MTSRRRRVAVRRAFESFTGALATLAIEAGIAVVLISVALATAAIVLFLVR